MKDFTIVRLVAYGDFDVPQTRSVWVGPANTEVPSSTTYGKDADLDRAEKDLKARGFSKARTRVLAVGGDL